MSRDISHHPFSCSQRKKLERAHDIVTGIDEHDFAGDGTRQIATEEESRIANFALIDIAAQRRYRPRMLAEGGEAGDATGRQRVERTGGDGVDPNIIRPQFKGQVTHAAL